MKKAVETRYFGWLAGAGLGLCLVAGAGTAMGQVTCTIENWQVGGSPQAVGLSASNVGTPALDAPVGGKFRRYAGPCGLRVPVDGTLRYLRDGSPDGEAAYNARFYAFLNNAGDDVTLFHALDQAGTVQVSIAYSPAAASLTLNVRNNVGATEALQFTQVPAGWHSIEFEWQADSNATIVFALNSDAPEDKQTKDVNTAGASIHEVRLGSLTGSPAAPVGSFVDFDDFDSRRTTPPGRLLRADVTNSGSVTLADVFAVNAERTGIALAVGQPDCNEDGSVTLADVFCVNAIRLGQ